MSDSNTGGPVNYTPDSTSSNDRYQDPQTTIVGRDEEGYPVNYLGERVLVKPMRFSDNIIQEREQHIEGVPTSSTCYIKDSGERREFESGAVRDIVEGKGRCDLVPLSSAAILIFSSFSPVPDIDYIKTHIEKIVLEALDEYISRFNEGIEVQERQLSKVVQNFLIARGWSRDDAFLEVSKHYEEGAKKYGEYNWQKGIPCHSYIDSAIRHLMKWSRGDNDEPHDRAFLWNMLSLHWTTVNHPELVDFISHGTQPSI